MQDNLTKNYFKIIISTILVSIIYVIISIPFYFVPIIGPTVARMLFLILVSNYFYDLCREGLKENIGIVNNILPSDFVNYLCVYILSFCIYNIFNKLNELMDINSSMISIIIFGFCFISINILKTSFIIYSIEKTSFMDGIVRGFNLVFRRPSLYIPITVIIFATRFIPYCGICISYLLILFLEYLKIVNYVNEKKYEF